MYNIYYVTGGDIGTPELTNIIEVVKIVHFHIQRALLYLTYFFKVIKQLRCFFGKNADEGKNPLNNPDIYIRDNGSSPGRQSLKTGSVIAFSIPDINLL
jgi:hypothetical protein